MTNHLRRNNAGRPRALKSWETRQTFRMVLNYRDSPAVHTFLYENQVNPRLRDIIISAMEEYFENHGLPYLDLAYCEQIRREAFDAENSLDFPSGKENKESSAYVSRVKKAPSAVETVDAADMQAMFAQMQAQFLEQQKMMQQQLEDQRREAENSRLAMEKQLQESLKRTANVEAAAIQSAAVIDRSVEVSPTSVKAVSNEKPNAEILSIAETLGEL